MSSNSFLLEGVAWLLNNNGKKQMHIERGKDAKPIITKQLMDALLVSSCDNGCSLFRSFSPSRSGLDTHLKSCTAKFPSFLVVVFFYVSKRKSLVFAAWMLRWPHMTRCWGNLASSSVGF
jgi:hypothetical protein